MATRDGAALPDPPGDQVAQDVGAGLLSGGLLPGAGILGLGGDPETADPTLDNITPTPGELIRPDTPIVFDITGPRPFVLIIPMIIIDPFRVPEPTHDNDNFEPLYEDESTRVAIVHAISGDDGYRYSLMRRGGWTTEPRLRVYAVDDRGNMFVGP
jgi:hypothetical protein